jgi:hypothetical protein
METIELSKIHVHLRLRGERPALSLAAHSRVISRFAINH